MVRLERQISVRSDDSLRQVESDTVSTMTQGTIGPCRASAKLVYVLSAVILVVIAGCFGFFFGRMNGEIGLALQCQQQKQQTVWCRNFDDVAAVPKGDVWKTPQNERQRPQTASSKRRDPYVPARTDRRQHITGTGFAGRRCGQRSLPSAHLYLDWPAIAKTGGVLSWMTTTPYSMGTGHLSRDVIYRPELGGLEVTEAGVYNVYSQLAFRPTSYTTAAFVQCLFRIRPKDGQTANRVLCTRTTKLNISDVQIDQPSRFQAAIKLEIGDTIFVNVSEIRSVFKSYLFNYFGLFKIPS